MKVSEVQVLILKLQGKISRLIITGNKESEEPIKSIIGLIKELTQLIADAEVNVDGIGDKIAAAEVIAVLELDLNKLSE